MLLIVWVAVTCIIVSVTLWKKRQQRSNGTGVWLSNLPDGPKPSSWMAGCFNDLAMNENIGDTDQEYVRKHGLAFKMNHVLGSDMLYLADPKGLYYVLERRPYVFHKEDIAKLNRVAMGSSILGVEGPDHVRQRKVLAPGFHQAVVRDLVPVFAQVGTELINKWNDIADGHQWSVVEVHSWLTRTTLDAVGLGLFSYDFGSLGDSPSEFVEAYRNVFFDLLHKRTPLEMTIGALLPRLPFWLMKQLKDFAFRGGPERFNQLSTTGKKIASDIVQRELRAAEGHVLEGKDVMSNLVRANFNEDQGQRMEEDVLYNQTLILTMAGHDTSASTLTWILYELAHNPMCQKKLRDEIVAFRTSTANRELNASDFESHSLPYTTAIIKETLRFYAIAPHLIRHAGCNEIIPLSQPIKTREGKLTDAISIRKGQPVLISLWSYNRVKELWGEDADVWNPERFLDDVTKGMRHSVGVYANLATFSSGVHSCIGWRFAVLELHTLLTILVEKFEFAPPDEDLTITRVGTSTVAPTLKGKEDLGPQLPLRIRQVTY